MHSFSSSWYIVGLLQTIGISSGIVISNNYGYYDYTNMIMVNVCLMWNEFMTVRFLHCLAIVLNK